MDKHGDTALFQPDDTFSFCPSLTGLTDWLKVWNLRTRPCKQNSGRLMAVWGAGANKTKRAPAAWDGAPASRQSWCIYGDTAPNPFLACGAGSELCFLLWKFTTDSTSSHFLACWATIEDTSPCQCRPNFPHWLIYYTRNLTGYRASTVIITIKILRNELPAWGSFSFRCLFGLF